MKFKLLLVTALVSICYGQNYSRSYYYGGENTYVTVNIGDSLEWFVYTDQIDEFSIILSSNVPYEYGLVGSVYPGKIPVWFEDGSPVIEYSVSGEVGVGYDGAYGRSGNNIWFDWDKASVDIALPIEFSFFNYILKNNNITLKWKTESEVANLGFEIEKSYDNIKYKLISSYKTHVELQGQGNSSMPHLYQYSEYIKRKSYYKLYNIDYDGSRHYCSEIIVEHNLNELNIYPNPSSVLNIYTTSDKKIVAKIYTSIGETIPIEFYNKISINNLSSGVYFIEYNSKIYKAIILK